MKGRRRITIAIGSGLFGQLADLLCALFNNVVTI
jgi:hypothetical protein